MGKLEDMALLVEVVEAGGLAAAGRRMNLSAATMTARLKALEERYQTRLFNRSTRSIALTRAGEEFYHSALRVLEEMTQAEAKLTQKEGILSGSLRISAPSDFGRQYLSPALLDFSRLHPEVKSSVYLSEQVVDLIAHRLDMSVRFGNLPDSNLVTRFIKNNHRVIVASPAYLEKNSPIERPQDLLQHRCLALESRGTLLNEWRFEIDGEEHILRVPTVMVCDDGALLRQWVLAGAGIASKSWWDVKRDVEQGRLKVLFADTYIGFSRHDKKQVGLQFVYPQRRFQPLQVTTFSEFFINWLEQE
ncbi:LysR family transcriptional regulator [Rouxiella silvae]|uniref:LysR family transcriptional regulator n=1 Tax=Rouxiella silvae TaxID=1646373 RepID=A0AA41BXX6_9GAMM|nr:LysR family transcriptional regulator [Rouxiella silvae]KQN49566.1 LysR family transcriptional regulator [Serratia sp. Leaf50]MBF6638626.1 LysR family transcriptional regulator [Rouxiella silvae]ORJ20572.1 LysR family transcriptional regulator [Rouxiella silvae]